MSGKESYEVRSLGLAGRKAQSRHLGENSGIGRKMEGMFGVGVGGGCCDERGSMRGGVGGEGCRVV